MVNNCTFGWLTVKASVKGIEIKMSEKQEEFLFTKDMFEHLPDFIDKFSEIEGKQFSSSKTQVFSKIFSNLKKISNLTYNYLEKSLKHYPNFSVSQAWLDKSSKPDYEIRLYFLIRVSDQSYIHTDHVTIFSLSLSPHNLKIQSEILLENTKDNIAFLKGRVERLKNTNKRYCWGLDIMFKKIFQSVGIDGEISSKFNYDVEINKEIASHMSVDCFRSCIDKIFKNTFPLMLISMPEAPIYNLCTYLNYQPPYILVQCSIYTGFKVEILKQWVKIIKRKQQVIFQGPPGTGKTFIAKEIAKHLIGGNDGFSELVQFHPAYTYEDFMQGIRPQTEDGQLTYSMVPGRFLEFCKKAESCKGFCVLIIDEINRANLSQVFGELMYLLEYRDEKICLAGSNEPFGIPSNVYIIGTMNTADRSIALVDNALRRRFSFITLSPNYDVLRQYHRSSSFSESFIEKLIGILKDLNETIDDPHHELGISFFLVDDLENNIEDIWTMEIEPYLEEYFYDNPDKIKNFRWSEIQKNNLKFKLKDFEDEIFLEGNPF